MTRRRSRTRSRRPRSIRATEPTADRRRILMAEEAKYRNLTREELDELAGEPLPEKAAMSLINANLAAPINAAVAANVLSDNSVAYANAEQTVDLTQDN